MWKAAEKFDASYGVKFLTYAEYRLKACFFVVAKLKNATGYLYHETKFDDEVTYMEESGELVTLADVIPCPRAEEEMLSVAERDYQYVRQAGLRKALDTAINRLTECQREVVVSHFSAGLRYSDYARRKGTTKQAAHCTACRALKKMAADSELAAYAV